MDFNLNEFHFTSPPLLWGNLLIPIVILLYLLFYKTFQPYKGLEKYIDKHLLPFLIIKNSSSKKRLGSTLIFWSMVWSFLIIALAGPRWDYREIETFSQDKSLVIALDLSESMNATDNKPSRLAVAKQKIEDLINASKLTKIGLIAFAADPHMIVPITEDKETIRHLLSSLSTDLVHVQGSRLGTTLEMAGNMLQAESGTNKAILIISDGGFEDSSAINKAKKLAEEGVTLYTMGVGTLEGAPMKNKAGEIIRKNNSILISKLEKERLIEISKVGKGVYFDTAHASPEKVILSSLDEQADLKEQLGKKNKLWEEHFYLMIFPALPLMLWWFRRGYIFGWMILFLSYSFVLEASSFNSYFENNDTRAKNAFDEGQFETARELFQDAYQKGVSCYRAGKYKEAEDQFRLVNKPEKNIDAMYNLGNSLALQQKYQEAIEAYEKVLKDSSDHLKAKENLEFIKKLQSEQNDQDTSDKKDDQNKKDKSKKSDKKNDQNKKNNKKSDQQDQEQEQNQPDQKDDKDQQNKNDLNQSENDEKKSENQPEDRDQQENDQNENSQNQPENHEEESANEEQKQFQPSDENASQQEEANKSSETDSKLDDQQFDEKQLSEQQLKDQDADLWLNRIANDPKAFLKNKFYIESKRNDTKAGIDPW